MVPDQYDSGLVPRSARILLLALALGLLAATGPARPAGARGAQEFGTTTSTVPIAGVAGTEATPSTLVGETSTTESNQTVVDNQPSEGKPLWSESRKVAAIIGALVFVALALTLLTIRYVRVTKPILLAPTPEPTSDSAATQAAAPAPVEGADPTPTAPVPAAVDPGPAEPAATDHAAVDASWTPRGTGEHPAVPVVARPGTDARRAALGATAEP